MKRNFQAVVADIVEEGRVQGRQRWLVLLDHTEFCAGDAGVFEAMSRGGVRLVISVLEALELNGQILHRVEKPLAVGTNVTGHVEHI